MKTKLLLLLFALFTIQIFGQEIASQKDTNLSVSTTTWDFICENYALTGITKIQISKTQKGGTIKLTVQTTNPSYIIAGTVYVDLADNTVFTCIDKKNRMVNGNEISSIYNFSTIEMNKLKITDIKTIRFNIVGTNNGFGSQTGSFTAINKKKYFSTNFDKTKKEYETAKEISLIYK